MGTREVTNATTNVNLASVGSLSCMLEWRTNGYGIQLCFRFSCYKHSGERGEKQANEDGSKKKNRSSRKSIEWMTGIYNNIKFHI